MPLRKRSVHLYALLPWRCRPAGSIPLARILLSLETFQPVLQQLGTRRMNEECMAQARVVRGYLIEQHSNAVAAAFLPCRCLASHAVCCGTRV